LQSIAIRQPTRRVSPNATLATEFCPFQQAGAVAVQRAACEGWPIDRGTGRDVERRGLLQSLNVRPVLNGEGDETGTYEVPAGGRRFRALELLVKQKKLAKTTPVPCVVREAGSAILAEDDSLAENV